MYRLGYHKAFVSISLGYHRAIILLLVCCQCINHYQFSLVLLLSHVWLFAIPWTAACQASLSITKGLYLVSAIFFMWHLDFIYFLYFDFVSYISSNGGEDPLEEGMGTHSSILAWRIPWTEESGGLQSIGWQSWTTTEATKHAHTSWCLHKALYFEMHKQIIWINRTIER